MLHAEQEEAERLLAEIQECRSIRRTCSDAQMEQLQDAYADLQEVSRARDAQMVHDCATGNQAACETHVALATDYLDWNGHTGISKLNAQVFADADVNTTRFLVGTFGDGPVFGQMGNIHPTAVIGGDGSRQDYDSFAADNCTTRDTGCFEQFYDTYNDQSREKFELALDFVPAHSRLKCHFGIGFEYFYW